MGEEGAVDKAQGQGSPRRWWHHLQLLLCSGVILNIRYDFKYYKSSAPFLPSARLYILTLDLKIKTFIIKANSGIGSFNATPPRTDFEREKQP